MVLQSSVHQPSVLVQVADDEEENNNGDEDTFLQSVTAGCFLPSSKTNLKINRKIHHTIIICQKEVP